MLKKLLTCHWLLTLFIMGLAALVFGLSSFNLFYFFKANLDLIAEYGTMALFDGALEQFFSLCGYGMISLGAYIIFKACEKNLVERLVK